MYDVTDWTNQLTDEIPQSVIAETLSVVRNVALFR